MQATEWNGFKISQTMLSGPKPEKKNWPDRAKILCFVSGWAKILISLLGRDGLGSKFQFHFWTGPGMCQDCSHAGWAGPV